MGVDGVQCPLCGQEFQLTWRRYFSVGPSRRIACPLCSGGLRLRHTRIYWAFLAGYGLLAVALNLIALGFLSLVAAALVAVVAALAIIIPLDRWVESRFAILVPGGQPPSDKRIKPSS